MIRAMLIEVLSAPEGAAPEHIVGIVADVVNKSITVKSEKPLLLLVEEFDSADEKSLKKYAVSVRIYDPNFIPTPTPT